MNLTRMTIPTLSALILAGPALSQTWTPASTPVVDNRRPTHIERDRQLPQDVLYDTLDIIYYGSYDAANGDAIGGDSIFGEQIDLQLADDVEILQRSLITEVACGYVNFNGTGDTEVMVEIFADAGGLPEEEPVLNACVYAVSESFSDVVFGLYGSILHAEVTEFDLCLDPATWWFSAQPVSDDWHYICRDYGRQTGWEAAIRDGGLMHGAYDACAGGGLPGGYGFSFWASMSYGGWSPGDAAMRVSGDPCDGCRLSLRQEGECPGTITLVVENGTPGGRIAIVYGFTDGRTYTNACDGLYVDIAAARLAGITVADGNGNVRWAGNVPPAACDRALVQAVDVTGCCKSNVIVIQ